MPRSPDRGIALAGLLLLCCGDLAYAEDAASPLDLAIEAGVRDPELRPDFYHLYRDTLVLLVLAREVPWATETEMVGLPLRTGLYNGLPLVNVFDSEERMRAFVQARGLEPSSPIMVRGEATLRLMATDYYLRLNPETSREKLFTPEEIRFLRGAAARDSFVEKALAAAALSDLVAAEPEPAALAAALQEALAHQPDVREAFVFRHPATPPGAAEPSYLVALRLDSRSEADHLATIQALSATIAGRIEEGRFVDVVPVSRSQLRRIAPAGAQPFYKRRGVCLTLPGDPVLFACP
jgi:hypothetical protein